MRRVLEIIESENLGKYEENVSLKKYTTYKVGGKASIMVYPKNIDCLIRLLKVIKEEKVKYKVLGNVNMSFVLSFPIIEIIINQYLRYFK